MSGGCVDILVRWSHPSFGCGISNFGVVFLVAFVWDQCCVICSVLFLFGGQHLRFGVVCVVLVEAVSFFRQHRHHGKNVSSEYMKPCYIYTDITSVICVNHRYWPFWGGVLLYWWRQCCLLGRGSIMVRI